MARTAAATSATMETISIAAPRQKPTRADRPSRAKTMRSSWVTRLIPAAVADAPDGIGQPRGADRLHRIPAVQVAGPQRPAEPELGGFLQAAVHAADRAHLAGGADLAERRAVLG